MEKWWGERPREPKCDLESESYLQQKKQITEYSVAPLFRKAALKFVLHWLRKQNSKLRVHISAINSIERFAAYNPCWPRHMANQDFADCYWQAPDLTAALLNFLRQKWTKLETSRAGKLKKFLSHEPEVKWDDEFNSREAVEEAAKIEKELSEIEQKLPPVPQGGRATIKEDYEFLELARTRWANRKHSGPTPNKLGQVAIWHLQDKEIQRAIAKLPWGTNVTVDEIAKIRKWVVKEQLANKKFAEKVLDKDGFLQVKS